MAMAVAYSGFCGELVHENRSGTKRAYVPDTLGSLAAMLDNTGSAVDELQYWPYGEIRNETGANSSPWTFVGLLGYFADGATTLYARSRHLALNYAQWLSVDPLWPREQAYQYVAGLPTTEVDPLGLSRRQLPPLDSADDRGLDQHRHEVAG